MLIFELFQIFDVFEQSKNDNKNKSDKNYDEQLIIFSFTLFYLFNNQLMFEII